MGIQITLNKGRVPERVCSDHVDVVVATMPFWSRCRTRRFRWRA